MPLFAGVPGVEGASNDSGVI